jgi:hypothetical protein
MMTDMGFALWSDGETAWAAGAHEYRPMGIAVVSATDLFRERDFRPAERLPARGGREFLGLFASLNDVNAHLRRMRSQKSSGNFHSNLRRQRAIV